VKSLRLKDKWGRKKYFRVKTVPAPQEEKASFNYCWGQLAKDDKGRIGALIMGVHHCGWLKIGVSERKVPYLFVSLDALPKKVRKKLLIPLNYELVEEEDTILAVEKDSHSFYVGSKNSRLFHEPGCPQAKRIKESYRIIFHTKKEALESGYVPHKICGG